MVVLTKEQLALQQRARELAQQVFKPTAAQTDLSEQYPWNNVRQLCGHGFMGMTIPREYGGQGRSHQDTIIVVEEMAKACATMGRITVEANMGAIGAIMQFGQGLARLLGLVGTVADDHHPAAFGQDLAGRLQPHAAAAADHQQFLAVELLAHFELPRRPATRA